MPALPSPNYIGSTVQSWFGSLPLRTRQILLVTVAGALGIFLVLIVVRWHHRSQPQYVLEVLDQINSPADVLAHSDYLTPQGKDVLLWLQKKANDEPATGTHAVYSTPVVYGSVCDIRFRAGEVTGSVRLSKVDHWRFDDFYVEEVGGKEVKLWTSYVKGHPVRAWWSVHGNEMFAAFLKGVAIGARFAK